MESVDEVSELRALLRARFPIILIETHEESRVIGLLEKACGAENQALFSWSIANGLARARSRDAVYNTHEFIDGLKHVDKTPQDGVYAFCDAHPGFKDAVCLRLIREIAMEHALTARTLVFISPTLEHLPAELLRLSAHFTPALPDLQRIRTIVSEEIALYQSQYGKNASGDQKTATLMMRHLLGLESEEVRRLVRHALRDDGSINQADLRRIIKIKYEALGGASALEYCDSGTGFDQLGGFSHLKRWTKLRHRPFLDATQEAMDRPKGIVLLGVQGAGKSLAARALAGEWSVPLLRLDMGALYNKYYGETERNVRNALKAADSMAPCVLWIDEIEKGFATGGEQSDGAVSRRVLGSFLTWMAERKRPVFIVATANDISALPPELIRKGRFDEIFFVDLPTAPAREQIFRIHLSKRKQDPETYDCTMLARESEGFSGAEIEQAIVSATFAAGAQDKQLVSAMLFAELQSTKPLSVIMAEDLHALRRWALGRAVFADDVDIAATAPAHAQTALA